MALSAWQIWIMFIWNPSVTYAFHDVEHVGNNKSTIFLSSWNPVHWWWNGGILNNRNFQQTIFVHRMVYPHSKSLFMIQFIYTHYSLICHTYKICSIPIVFQYSNHLKPLMNPTSSCWNHVESPRFLLQFSKLQMLRSPHRGRLLADKPPGVHGGGVGVNWLHEF